MYRYNGFYLLINLADAESEYSGELTRNTPSDILDRYVARSSAAMASTLQDKQVIVSSSMGGDCNYIQHLNAEKWGEMEMYINRMNIAVLKIHGGIKLAKCGWIRFPVPHLITHRLCLASKITRFWSPPCPIRFHKRQIGFVLGRQEC